MHDHLDAAALFRSSSSASGSIKSLIEARQDVLDMLEADRQADIALRHAGSELFLGRKLRVGRGCRMDGKTSCIADIGDMIARR